MANGAVEQLRALNRNLTVNQKISIVALALVVLAGILGFVHLLRSDGYRLLASDLAAEDATAVIQRLEQLNIPFDVSDGGRTVMVPAGHLNVARIEVASEGLPRQGRIGFELFDQTNWSITDFGEKVNYRRALEGELARSIVSLREVSQARVHLVMERPSLFLEERRPAKASVVIELRGQGNLPPQRVRGITNLVAYAVEGLSPEHVTVVDIHGNLLSGYNGESAALDERQTDHRNKLEQDLVRKVISVLEPLVGQDRVRATASVTLELRETQQTEEIYDPEGTVVLSRQRSEERDPEGSQIGGVPGTTANEGGEIARVETGGRVRESETVNYEVSKTIRQMHLPRGGIQQISMAVVVDDKVVVGQDEDGRRVEQVVPREPEEIERLRNLAGAAIGFNPERGDILTVDNLSFRGVQEESPIWAEPTFWERNQSLLQPVLRYLFMGLLFLAFYLFIFRPLKRMVQRQWEFAEPELAQLAAATGRPDMVHELEEKMSRLSESGRPKALAGADLPKRSSEAEEIKKQLVELARKEPEAVTQLIRNWLAERS